MDKKILVSDLYSILFNNCINLEKEEISIDNAYKRIPSKEIIAKIDNPPFNKSAMDGYGYYDTGDKVLELLDDNFLAGDFKNIDIPRNSCIRIMTGAMVPESVNKVSKFEATSIIERNGKKYVSIDEKEKSNNIIYKASNVKIGDKLIDIKPLNSEDISILASNGYSSIEVVKSPKVGIITTGNELIDINQKLENCKIYDSNRYLIENKLRDINIDYKFYGIFNDNYDDLYSIISTLLKEVDIIIISGGMSVGDVDYTRNVLDDLGIEKMCHGVSIKPGKPFYFGIKKENKIIKNAVFGLPGNPFATLVSLENFVKPYIYNSIGYKYSNFFYKFQLLNDFKRKNDKLEEYLPVKFINTDKATFVSQLDYKGSFYLPFGIKALMKVDIGVKEIKSLQYVEVRFI